MVMPTAFAFAAAAGLCLAERAATTGDKELDRFPDRACVFLVVNINTDLLKARKRTPAHAAGEENLDPALFEEGHGCHAPALYVPRVLEN